jgi:hypothetical protein
VRDARLPAAKNETQTEFRASCLLSRSTSSQKASSRPHELLDHKAPRDGCALSLFNSSQLLLLPRSVRTLKWTGQRANELLLNFKCIIQASSRILRPSGGAYRSLGLMEGRSKRACTARAEAKAKVPR